MRASRATRILAVVLAATLIACAFAGVARAEESVTVTSTIEDSADALAATLIESTDGSESVGESEPGATVSSLQAEVAAEGTEGEPIASGGETTSEPIDISGAATASDPEATSEASPLPSEPSPPPSDPLPPPSDPLPPPSEASPASELAPLVTERPEANTYAEWLGRTSVVSTLFAELAPPGETLVADLGARSGPPERSPGSDAAPLAPERAPAPPPQAPAPAGFGGGPGGSASGFSFTAFALLSALLVLACPGMGRLIGLSLISPHAPLLVTRLQRPG